MRITAISFDGDMTLWDFRKVMRHSLKKALAELRRLVPSARPRNLSVEEMIAIRSRVEEEEQGRTWNMEELRLLAFERTLESIGSPDRDLAARLNELYLKHRFEDIELYPDVEPALDILAPHFKLGLLSNGNSYPERCGLEGRFAFVVFSQDVQIRKPDRRIFEIAAREAGCPMEELMHVGDSFENDVMGAHEAGAKTVWLNREGMESKAEIKADYEITSLADLPGVLGLGQNRKLRQIPPPWLEPVAETQFQDRIHGCDAGDVFVGRFGLRIQVHPELRVRGYGTGSLEAEFRCPVVGDPDIQCKAETGPHGVSPPKARVRCKPGGPERAADRAHLGRRVYVVPKLHIFLRSTLESKGPPEVEHARTQPETAFVRVQIDHGRHGGRGKFYIQLHIIREYFEADRLKIDPPSEVDPACEWRSDLRPDPQRAHVDGSRNPLCKGGGCIQTQQ